MTKTNGCGCFPTSNVLLPSAVLLIIIKPKLVINFGLFLKLFKTRFFCISIYIFTMIVKMVWKGIANNMKLRILPFFAMYKNIYFKISWFLCDRPRFVFNKPDDEFTLLCNVLKGTQEAYDFLIQEIMFDFLLLAEIVFNGEGLPLSTHVGWNLWSKLVTTFACLPQIIYWHHFLQHVKVTSKWIR